jgi:hypothetical protein
MIETAFYARGNNGEPDRRLGSIRLAFTVQAGEKIEFLNEADSASEALHSIAMIAVQAEIRPGVWRGVTLAQAPAFWLRNIAREYTNAYQRAEVLTDTAEDPDALGEVPVVAEFGRSR